jgi:hypothetical protein
MLRSMSGFLVSHFRSKGACREFASSAIIKPLPLPTIMMFPRWTTQQRVVLPTNNTLVVRQQDPILSAMLKQHRPEHHAPETLQALNRNARKGKRANKGARPCSRIARRAKKRANGNWRR